MIFKMVFYGIILSTDMSKNEKTLRFDSVSNVSGPSGEIG